MKQKKKRSFKKNHRRPGPGRKIASQNRSNARISRADGRSRAGNNTAKQQRKIAAKKKHSNVAFQQYSSEDFLYWAGYDVTVLLSLGSRELSQ